MSETSMTKNAVLKAIAAIGRKSAKFGGESVSVLGFCQPKEPAELKKAEKSK